jgi:hypothetical protein
MSAVMAAVQYAGPLFNSPGRPPLDALNTILKPLHVAAVDQRFGVCCHVHCALQPDRQHETVHMQYATVSLGRTLLHNIINYSKHNCNCCNGQWASLAVS